MGRMPLQLRLSCHGHPCRHTLDEVGERPQRFLSFGQQFWPFGWSKTTKMASTCGWRRRWSEAITSRVSAFYGACASHGFAHFSVFHVPISFPLWSIPCPSFAPSRFSKPPCPHEHAVHRGNYVMVACCVLGCAIRSACDCFLPWPSMDSPKNIQIEVVTDFVRTVLWNWRTALWSKSSYFASFDCAASSTWQATFARWHYHLCSTARE